MSKEQDAQKLVQLRIKPLREVADSFEMQAKKLVTAGEFRLANRVIALMHETRELANYYTGIAS